MASPLAHGFVGGVGAEFPECSRIFIAIPPSHGERAGGELSLDWRSLAHGQARREAAVISA